MNLDENITKWAKNMGYTGKMPTHMKRFANESTAIIWNQIIENIKPRKEIEQIRGNILINRLKSKIPIKQYFTTHQPMELIAYNNKIKAIKARKDLDTQISENEVLLRKLSKSNKVEKLDLETMKANLEEIAMKSLILKENDILLSTDCKRIEDKVAFLQNTTPVEEESSKNKHADIILTLKQCAEKLSSLPNSQPNLINKSQSLDYSLGLLDLSGLNFSTQSINLNIDKNVIDVKLEQLFRTTNRNTINKCISTIEEGFLSDLRKLLLKFDDTKNHKIECTNEFVTELYSTHVYYTLLARKHFVNWKKLERDLDLKKQSFVQLLKHQNYTEKQIDDLMAILALQSREAGLQSVSSYLNKTVDSIKTDLSNNSGKIELEAAREQLNDLVNSIVEIKSKLSTKLRQLSEKQTAISNLRELSFVNVNQLSRYTDNLNWLNLLNEKVVSKELEVFKQFPLEFNKKYDIEDNLYYRDVCMTDQNTNELLISLDINPLKAPEDILVDILNDMSWLSKLTAVSANCQVMPVSGEHNTKYNLTELDKSHIKFEKLLTTLQQTGKMLEYSRNKISLRNFSNVSNIWIEMKFSDVFPDTKLLNSQNFKYYEKLYDSYYNNL